MALREKIVLLNDLSVTVNTPTLKKKKPKKLNNLTDELKVMRERVKANVPNAAVLSLSTGAPGLNLQTFLVLFEASGAF